MKGMMVQLLALMMTGMVIGQQPQTSDNSSEAANAKVGRFLLDMTDQWIGSLKENGLLQAPIQPDARDHINQIDIRYKNNASNSELIPAQITQIGSGSDGKLQFGLTDNDIEIMKRRGLRYTIREEDRGNYDEVVIRYYPPPRSAATGLTGQGVERNDSNRFDSPTGWTADHSPPASASSEFGGGTYNLNPRDNSSLTPSTSSENFSRRDSNVANNNFPSWSTRQNNDQFTPQSQEFTVPDRSSSNGFAPVVDRNQNSVRAVDLQALQDRMVREEAERLQRQRIENERIQAEQLAAARIAADRLAEQRIAAQKQLDRQRYLDSIRDTPQGERIRGDRYAMRSDDSYRYPFADDTRPIINYPTNRFPNRQYEDYGDALASTNVNTPSLPPQRVTLGPTGPVPAAILGPDSNNFERVAQKTSTNQLPASRLGATTAADAPVGTLAEMNLQMSRMRQTTGMLWFMMLCSLGLNVYLGWIARGFYVRYEELADELRETFTSTM